MARGLAQAGARVAVVSRNLEACQKVAETIRAEGGQALGVSCDVTERESLAQALERVMDAFGPPDILVNGAGGNQPLATATPERSFFELDNAAIEKVFNLNFQGTLLACQVFGRVMAERGQGQIVNIASMASQRPLTRVVAYGAAKAAVVNLTQWLAVNMAQEYGSNIRVMPLHTFSVLVDSDPLLLHKLPVLPGKIDREWEVGAWSRWHSHS
jgi:NAD(P)-dependent dehydrogenase (short-subunit alcohol dehydrogenase family)